MDRKKAQSDQIQTWGASSIGDFTQWCLAANIHLYVCKVSLFDYGLSDCTSNEEHKENIFECFDNILEILETSGSSKNSNAIHQDSEENEGMLPDNAGTDDKSGSNDNSSPEEIFGKMSLETNGTSTT